MLAQNSNKHTSTPALFAALLTVFTVLSGLLLSGPHTSAANTGNLDTSVSVTAACSLSVDDTSHSASVIPGNNVAIGTSTVKAICNDPSGLAVYMVGYTGSQYGNTTLTANINETTQTIPTGNAGSPSNSQWNMTINAVTGTYTPTIPQEFNNTAHVIPTTYTKVAYRNTMTDAGLTATGANFTAAFNAYVSMTQPAGTYTGKVKFLLVHPNVLAWEEDPQNPGTLIPDEVQPSTLARDPEAPFILQEVSTWGSSVALEETVEATDNRDGQTYQVKRLKMNAAGTETALWMSNLNLGAEPITVSQLDSTNTHLASGASSIPANAISGWITSIGTSDYVHPQIMLVDGTDLYGNRYSALYNYAAASANTYTYSGSAGTGNATSDLCPAGWRMPTGSSSGELNALTNAYGFGNDGYISSDDELIALQQDLGFILPGEFWSNTTYTGDWPLNKNVSGTYWSSTRYDGYDMHVLFINAFWTFIPFGTEGRLAGVSLRCIAQ